MSVTTLPTGSECALPNTRDGEQVVFFGEQDNDFTKDWRR